MQTNAVIFDLFDTLVDLSMSGLPRLALKPGAPPVPTTLGALHKLVCAHKTIPLQHFCEQALQLERNLRAPRNAAGRELPTLERMQALCAALQITDAPQLPYQLTRAHMQQVQAQSRALPHHIALLTELRRRGLRLAVCSNFSHSQTALHVLEQAGLRWLLDAVVVSDAVTWRKPQARIFQTTLAALAAAPAETLHVGDSLSADVAGAAAVGMRTVWITRRVPDAEAQLAAYEGARPTYTITDLRELLELL